MMYTVSTVTRRELLASYEEGTPFAGALASWLNKAQGEGFDTVSVMADGVNVTVVFRATDKPKK